MLLPQCLTVQHNRFPTYRSEFESRWKLFLGGIIYTITEDEFINHIHECLPELVDCIKNKIPNNQVDEKIYFYEKKIESCDDIEENKYLKSFLDFLKIDPFSVLKYLKYTRIWDYDSLGDLKKLLSEKFGCVIVDHLINISLEEKDPQINIDDVNIDSIKKTIYNEQY